MTQQFFFAGGAFGSSIEYLENVFIGLVCLDCCSVNAEAAILASSSTPP
jgi:hypothetical protein